MKKKETKIKNQKVKNPPEQSRRDFFKTAWKTLGVIAGLEVTGLTIHFLSNRKNGELNQKLFEVGIPEEFPVGSVTPFRQGQFYLIRLNNGGFLAVSLKCSHLGCSILWDEKSNEFLCPCHSSEFSITGEVVKPPAPRALDLYEIEYTKGKLFINLSKKTKRDKFETSQLIYV